MAADLDRIWAGWRSAYVSGDGESRPVPEGDGTIFERILNSGLPDDQTYENALSDDMERALDTLADREKRILSLYFGLGGEEPLTLEEIGQKLGLTRERIRQIKEKAISRLRHSSRAKYLQGYIDS